jgi:hypothetical protein
VVCGIKSGYRVDNGILRRAASALLVVLGDPIPRFYPTDISDVQRCFGRVDKYGSFHKNHKIHAEALAFFFVTALTEPELIEAI